MDRIPSIYIMTNRRNGTLYTGVTNCLARRVWEHRCHLVAGFTKRYNLQRLVYFETFSDMREAIEREKKIKAGSRKGKERLIESINPEWRDLYPDII